MVWLYSTHDRLMKYMCEWSTGAWIWQGKNEVLWEKPVPVSLYSRQIPYGMAQDWTLGSTMTGWQMTTSAMAWTLKLNTLWPQDSE